MLLINALVEIGFLGFLGDNLFILYLLGWYKGRQQMGRCVRSKQSRNRDVRGVALGVHNGQGGTPLTVTNNQGNATTTLSAFDLLLKSTTTSPEHNNLASYGGAFLQ